MRKSRISLLTAALLIISFAAFGAVADTEKDESILPETFDTLAKAVGLDDAAEAAKPKRKIKIALFDVGFRGYADALGLSIPLTTKLRKGPIAVDPKTEEAHGLKMAEILSGLLDRTSVDYELHLFQTAGYSNLAAAVDTAIIEKFDLISYSQVWEYGENDDGKGFVNELVNRATGKGIIWVNAVGNFGKTTYRTAVERTEDDWAYLPGPNNSVQVRCKKNDGGKCLLRLVLSWNSYSLNTEAGTDKDLDLVLTDDTLKVIKTGGLVQKKHIPQGGQAGASIFPREVIEAEVKPGLYYARVKIRSNNFSKAEDTLRITLSGTFTEMLNRTEGETIFAPADNPSVISVGTTDADQDSVSRRNQRPDVRVASLVKTADGGQFKGSSNSAIATAARIALELAKLSERRSASRESLLQVLSGGRARPTTPTTNSGSNSDSSSNSRESTQIDFAATGSGGCYVYHALRLTVSHVQSMLRAGGVVVETTMGPKIFIDENPFERADRLGLRVSQEDRAERSILVADTAGLYSTAEANRKRIGTNAVEIVRSPRGATFCSIR